MNDVSLSLHLIAELLIGMDRQPCQLDQKPASLCYRNVTSQQRRLQVIDRKLVLRFAGCCAGNPDSVGKWLVGGSMHLPWDRNQLERGLRGSERGKRQQEGTDAIKMHGITVNDFADYRQ